jgi:hypothetical protein
MDVVIACVDLIGRTGAKEFTFGYLHDDVPAEQADWWAAASYQGARIQVEHHKSPDAATQALAQRLLTGAKCTHCHGLIALSDEGAMFYEGAALVDGSKFTREEAETRRQCRYRLVRNRWVRGCAK